MPSFGELLQARWDAGRFVCVGLDPDLDKISVRALGHCWLNPRGTDVVVKDFFGPIIEATRDSVCAYKPNAAFFEGFGVRGYIILDEVVRLVRELAPDVPIILDYNRAATIKANRGSADLAFRELEVDAVTVNPYFGAEAMTPFLDWEDKGVFVIVRTSNSGANELQGLEVIEGNGHGYSTEKAHCKVARNVSNRWNYNENCGVVAGADPHELQSIRAILGDEVPILIPAISVEDDSLRVAVEAGASSCGQGVIVSGSYCFLYASSGNDFAEAAGQAAARLNSQIMTVVC